jgi:hypothetical protein
MFHVKHKKKIRGIGMITDILGQFSIEFYILAGLFLVVFFIFSIYVTVLKKSFRKLKEKYEFMINGTSGTSLEGILFDHIERVNELVRQNKEIESKINEIERNLMLCVQRVGIVRYNAFDNMGSDLSFAIALLDKNNDGVVLNGIFSRDSSVVYAKPVFGGMSKHPLSAEEVQAIDRAQKGIKDQTNTGGKQNE